MLRTKKMVTLMGLLEMGDALCLLDFSGYLMADPKYFGEEISIIKLIP